MPATVAAREDRIELRTTKDEKRLLAAAAAYERLDVTSFIMRAVLPAAREVVDRAERIVLTERDTARERRSSDKDFLACTEIIRACLFTSQLILRFVSNADAHRVTILDTLFLTHFRWNTHQSCLDRS